MDPTETAVLSQLESELTESQKVRSDLLKWKIVLVAALGGTGLGLVNTSGDAQRYADLVLCLIPFVNVYVDVLCRHLSLRIKVIGEFRRKAGKDIYAPYETFVEGLGGTAFRNVLGLESLALLGSSLFFAFALIVVPNRLEPPLPHATAIEISGGIGLVATVVVELLYHTLKNRVNAQEIHE